MGYRPLAQFVRTKLWSGLLPIENSSGLSVQHGDGGACSACDDPILGRQREYSFDDPRGKRFRLHAACYGLWEAERRRNGWTRGMLGNVTAARGGKLRNVCGLCRLQIAPGTAVAAFRRRMAHVSCWLDWRDGRMVAPPPAVLLVEDDAATRYATRKQLEQGAFSVNEAASGAAALDAVRQQPDLVLLDLNLPDLDGFEICHRIKAHAETEWTRVLAFTAVFTSEADRRRAFDAGADGYLTKPVPSDELLTAVGMLVEAD